MINISFYRNDDVILLAKLMLGKELITNLGNNLISSGIICETEAYNGINDKACHAFNNRRTERTEIMYASGGVTYVYLCYGMHYLFNIVTGKKDNPQAVLIRGIIPYKGYKLMQIRCKKPIIDLKSGSGPGRVTKLLGIKNELNKTSMVTDKIYLNDLNIYLSEQDISCGPRIGVDYAGEDALLPYRFLIKDERKEQIYNQVNQKLL